MAETSKNKIYYNDNENSVADVLADMKKMAESTDEAIEKSKYNDATIKKSISDVEKKQVEKNTEQDSKIVELQTEKAKLETELKEIQEDFYQNSIRGQASGEYIHVEDSSNCRAKVGISGNSEQETREGYNLLPPSKQYTYTNGNVKLASDGIGKYTMNGDGTSKTEATKYTFTLKKEYTIKNNDYLHIMNEGTISSNAALILIDNNDEGIVLYDFRSDNRIENLSNYAGKTIKAIQLYMNPIKVDITLTPMIINNVSTAKNFEQYGVMPSPDYPSEIKAVGSNGSVKVTKCNKNLSKYKTFTSTSSARVVGDTTTSGQQIEGIKIRKGKKYTISFDVVSLPSSDYRIQIRESTDESIAQTDREIPNSIQNEPLICNTLTRHSKTITAQGDNYIYIKCIPKGFVLDNIQVEEKETSTSFEQHKEQSYIMPVQKEMLEDDYFDWDNEEEVHTWNKLVLDGTEDGWLKREVASEEYRFEFPLFSVVALDNNQTINILCDKLKGLTADATYLKQEGISASTWVQIYLKEFSRDKTVEDFKNWLKEHPLTIYYKLATPERLKFTNEQKEVAKKLNNARTYKNVTNITTDSKAILSLDYVKDLETLLNNMQALAVNNASEGV